MARYLGPKCKLCRREGTQLMLKGERCLSSKCAILKKRPSPAGGSGGRRRRSKMSEYAVQLREKQKIKRFYGLLEKPFRLMFKKAASKKGVTGEILLQFLELRLDSIVYNLGFACSRNMAKQLILHGHVLVNGTKVNTPSFSCRENDVVSIKEKSKRLRPIMESLKNLATTSIPTWMELNEEKLEGRIISSPKREDIRMAFNEQLVVELYSK